MEKIRKFMIPVLVAIIAIGSSVSYLKKGDVLIEKKETVQESISMETGPETEEKASSKVNLNTASEEELQIAPGIGPAKAQAIIKYRNEYGNFSSVDELIEISGIGEKTLQKIKDYYTVE